MIKVNLGVKTRRYEEENILEKLDRLSQQESKLRQDVNKRDEFVDNMTAKNESLPGKMQKTESQALQRSHLLRQKKAGSACNILSTKKNKPPPLDCAKRINHILAGKFLEDPNIDIDELKAAVKEAESKGNHV